MRFDAPTSLSKTAEPEKTGASYLSLVALGAALGKGEVNVSEVQRNQAVEAGIAPAPIAATFTEIDGQLLSIVRKRAFGEVSINTDRENLSHTLESLQVYRDTHQDSYATYTYSDFARGVVNLDCSGASKEVKDTCVSILAKLKPAQFKHFMNWLSDSDLSQRPAAHRVAVWSGAVSSIQDEASTALNQSNIEFLMHTLARERGTAMRRGDQRYSSYLDEVALPEMETAA